MKLAIALTVFMASTFASADPGTCGALGRVAGEDVVCARFNNTDEATCKKADGWAWCSWQKAETPSEVPTKMQEHGITLSDLSILLTSPLTIENLKGRGVTKIRLLDSTIKTYELEAGSDCKIKLQLTQSAPTEGNLSIVQQLVNPVEGSL